MPYIRIRNSADQSVMIDETYKNLALKSKGTFQSSDSVVPVAITVNGVNPVVAVRSTGTLSPVLLHSVQQVNATTWTYRYLSKAGDTVTYYVFDEPGGAPLQYLIVRNPTTGQVTFNAGEDYFIPVSEQAYTWSNTGAGNSPRSLPAGRTYAAVQTGGNNGFSSSFLGTGIWATAVFGVGAYFNNDGVILEGKPIYSTQSAQSLGNSPATGRFLIADVTNY